MPEDRYIKHVTEVLTEGEGKLTKPQAQAQWQLGSIDVYAFVGCKYL